MQQQCFSLAVCDQVIPDDKAQTTDDDECHDSKQHQIAVVEGGQRGILSQKSQDIKSRVAKGRYCQKS